MAVCRAIAARQDLFEPAPGEIPDVHPHIVPSACRRPSAVGADGDRDHAGLARGDERPGVPAGRVRILAVHQEDTEIILVDHRQCSPAGKPACLETALRRFFLQEHRWPDAERVVAAGRVVPDRPAEQASIAVSDEILAVAVEEDRHAVAHVELGQLPAVAPVEKIGGLFGGNRDQPAVWAELGRVNQAS